MRRRALTSRCPTAPPAGSHARRLPHRRRGVRGARSRARTAAALTHHADHSRASARSAVRVRTSPSVNTSKSPSGHANTPSSRSDSAAAAAATGFGTARTSVRGPMPSRGCCSTPRTSARATRTGPPSSRRRGRKPAAVIAPAPVSLRAPVRVSRYRTYPRRARAAEQDVRVVGQGDEHEQQWLDDRARRASRPKFEKPENATMKMISARSA